MMLTRATAGDLGVSDRTNAEQSIFGGARYVARLMARLPETIEGEDRLWFTAAAYNMGLGHVTDLRLLAYDRGLDANSWAAVRPLLHELETPEVYRRLTYGYARGLEAAKYVRRVRLFADILEKRFAPPPETAEGEAESAAEAGER